MGDLDELRSNRGEFKLRIGGERSTGKDVLACRSKRVEWELRGRGTKGQSGGDELQAHVDDQD